MAGFEMSRDGGSVLDEAERSEELTSADGTRVATWPLEANDLELAATWLADETNAQWLDFGPGVGALTPPMLRMMTKRDQHCIWVYGPPGEQTPAGLVGLGQIQPDFRAAEIWYVLGDKNHARKGLTHGAVCRMLEHAFGQLGLHCVYAWTVESNVPSRRVLEKAGFRVAGRIRDRHPIGGVPHDRLWFDLLADEFDSTNPQGQAEGCAATRV